MERELGDIWDVEEVGCTVRLGCVFRSQCLKRDCVWGDFAS